MKRRKSTVRNSCIIGVLVALLIVVGAVGMKSVKTELTATKAMASSLKADMKSLASSLKDMNADKAQKYLDKVLQDTSDIRAFLDQPLIKTASKVPFAKNEFNAVDKLLDAVESTSASLLQPLIHQIKEYPLDKLKADGKFNTEMIAGYLQLAETALTETKPTIEGLRAVKLGLLDRDGKITGMIATANAVLDIIEIQPEQIRGMIELIEKEPLDNMKVDGKVNTEWFVSYLEYFKPMIPQVQKMVSKAAGLDKSVLDHNSKIYKLIQSADVMLNEGNVVQDVEELLDSAIELITKYPLGNLKEDDRFHVATINHYLDFVDAHMLQVNEIMAAVNASKIVEEIGNKQLKDYRYTVNDLLKLYNDDNELYTFVRKCLGDGSDKTYLLAAVNGSEVRASGGFPGAAGTISIRNGYLKIGEFKSIYDVMTGVPGNYETTGEESILFLNAMFRSWDASYCPDFERVGYIWSKAYEHKNGTALDGVIAMTPEIIQKLLNVVGSVKLDGGKVLDGSNATHYLQYDIYFDFFKKTDVSMGQANKDVDVVFSETAQKVIKKVLGDLHLHYIPKFVTIVKDSFADRTMELWMKDESLQKTVRELGWSGGLNTDPQAPQAGIYLNCTIASKMGWFVEMDTDLGEPTANADGSKTYPITVNLRNIMTDEERKVANNYILGGADGCFVGSLYLFAPAGGTVSDIKVSNGVVMTMREYNGMQLGHWEYVRLEPQKSVEVTYQVTTAPGVDAPLTLSKTPTLQAYH